MRRERASRRALRASRAGFTMIEVMIAIGVLLVAVMSAFSSQLTSLNLMNTSRETNVASADLQACMEQVLTLPADQIPVPGSDFEADLEVANYTDLNLENERLVATFPGYVVGQPVPDPLQIVLTLSWSDYQGRERDLTLRSMKVR